MILGPDHARIEPIESERFLAQPVADPRGHRTGMIPCRPAKAYANISVFYGGAILVKFLQEDFVEFVIVQQHARNAYHLAIPATFDILRDQDHAVLFGMAGNGRIILEIVSLTLPTLSTRSATASMIAMRYGQDSLHDKFGRSNFLIR